jgi:hypothetical protein
VSSADLLQRREQLIAQCEAQRTGIAVHTAGLAAPIRIADRAVNVMHYLRAHPLAMAAAVAGLAIAQRRGALKWGQRALLVWRAWQAVRGRLGSR